MSGMNGSWSSTNASLKRLASVVQLRPWPPSFQRTWAPRGALPWCCVICPFSRTLKCMEVHFTLEQEAQLAKVATIAGTDPERLVKDAALRVVEDVPFRAAVRGGIAPADRGEFIEEEEIDARFEEMLRS